MLSSIILLVLGFVLGAIVTAVVLNNQHRKWFARIIMEVDEYVDRAEELSTSSWKRIKQRLTNDL
jgi:hypothetical protein